MSDFSQHDGFDPGPEVPDPGVIDDTQNAVLRLDLEALVNEFPQLGDPDVGPRVMDAARDQANRTGAPHLATNREHIRNVFLAGLADAAMAANAPLTQEQMAERDTEQMFGGSRQGRRALPF